MRHGHLERFTIHLRTLSPVFIGSGEELSKKEYILDRNRGKIHVPNLAELIGLLNQRSLLPTYEAFLLSRENNLYQFLANNGINHKDYTQFVSYSIDAGEAIRSEHFRGVLTFIKGPDGRPYIPGSSLKGAIRTAIAAKLLRGANVDRTIVEIERASDDFRNVRRYISREARNLEDKLFCKLNITDPKRPDKIKWFDMINDFMKGIGISDSKSIEFENLVLSGKFDRKPSGDTKQLPIYRECLAPGTDVQLVLTLDKPVLSKVGIDVQYIEEALRSFAEGHNKDFEQYFTKLPEDARVQIKDGVGVILGGGAGYVAKTLTYPMLTDRTRALKLVSKIMAKQFRKHKHEDDVVKYKVSPHILKTTLHKQVYHQMGRCELVIM